eukprot:scaffold199596_cov15-Tisochrysis_lutea.AAC.1
MSITTAFASAKAHFVPSMNQSFKLKQAFTDQLPSTLMVHRCTPKPCSQLLACTCKSMQPCQISKPKTKSPNPDLDPIAFYMSPHACLSKHATGLHEPTSSARGSAAASTIAVLRCISCHSAPKGPLPMWVASCPRLHTVPSSFCRCTQLSTKYQSWTSWWTAA